MLVSSFRIAEIHDLCLEHARLPLDSYDTRILSELQADARLSMAELGRRVHLSQPAVTERVRKLEAAGVITGYRATVEPRRLGYGIRAIVRVGRADYARWCSRIDKPPEVRQRLQRDRRGQLDAGDRGASTWRTSTPCCANLSDLTETSTSVILRTPREHQPMLPPRAVSEVPAEAAPSGARAEVSAASRQFSKEASMSDPDPVSFPPATCATCTRPTPAAPFACCRRCFATSAVERFCGQVVTVKCFEDNSPVKAAVESPGEERVLVVDGGGSLRRALSAAISARTAAKNGWAGDRDRRLRARRGRTGGMRDRHPRAGLMPLPTEKRGEGQHDLAVEIQGVWVRPGDWLYADEDGIVVLERPEKLLLARARRGR